MSHQPHQQQGHGIVERYNATLDIYTHKKEEPKLSSAYVLFKIILLVANLIFMIFACVLMGVGSYALNAKVNNLVGSTLPTGLIVVGAFMLLLAGIGAISAWKESRFGLGVYFAFLAVITIILFAVAIAVYVKKDSAGVYIAQAWNEAPNDVLVDIQNALDCCGLTSNIDKPGMPCPESIKTPQQNISCLQPMVDTFESAYKKAGGTGIAFAVIMGVAMFLVCCLMEGIKKRQFQAQASKQRQATQQKQIQSSSVDDVDNAEVTFDALDVKKSGVGKLKNIDQNAASMFDKQHTKPKRKTPSQQLAEHDEQV